MSLTPMDIHQKEFKSARLGGYNEEDVDAFLDIIADEIENLLAENEVFKAELDTLRKRLSEFEEMQSSLQSALITATKSAEDVKNQSTREAEEILMKAKREAESIVRYAQDESGRIIGEAKNEENRIHKKLEKIRQVKKQYIESIKQIADMQLKQVKELEEKDKQIGGLAEDLGPMEEPMEIINSVMSEMKAANGSKGEVEEKPEVVEKTNEQEVKSQPEKPVETELHSGDVDITGRPSEPVIDVTANTVISTTTTVENVEQSLSQPVNNVGVQNKEEKEELRKQDLVQEVLGIDFGDDIYSGLEGIEEEKGNGGRRFFGRRDKKAKNQFWE